MDIKTALDEARPRHRATIVESHNTHGWIVPALLRGMAGLEGQAVFDCVASNFSFNRCLRQGGVEVPRLWQKMATRLLANVEETWAKKRMGAFLELEGQGHNRHAVFCGPTTFGLCPTPKVTSNRCCGICLEKAEKWDSAPKPTSLWWTSTYDPEERGLIFRLTRGRDVIFPLKKIPRSWDVQ